MAQREEECTAGDAGLWEKHASFSNSEAVIPAKQESSGFCTTFPDQEKT
jgi:hypothetical protein